MEHPAPEHIKETATSQWSDAMLGIELAGQMFHRDGKTFPVIWIKAQPGPVLDRWFEIFKDEFSNQDIRNLPVGIDTDRLLGGLDISGTLASGSRMFQPGLLSQIDQGILILKSPERHEFEIVSHLCQALDLEGFNLERDGWSKWISSQFGLVIIDDGTEDESVHLSALKDRAAFHLDVSLVDWRTAQSGLPSDRNRSKSPALAGPDVQRKIVELALAFGLSSLRPARQALAIAQAHGVLRGAKMTGDPDVQAAVRLSFLGRAQVIPEVESDADDLPDNEPPALEDQVPDQKQEEHASNEQDVPDEFDVEAMLATLPRHLLDQLANQKRTRSAKRKTGQSGMRNVNFKRGRMLSSVKGRPGNGKRLDVIATLRSAVPWQNERRRNAKSEQISRIEVRPDDFHVRRFRRKSETSIVFVVDASGSTAVQRLGEAKGAVELLLAEGYARRDHVSLVSMRARNAEVLLSPTRSLVGAKRCLAALVGGGGTPLADGLQKAHCLALEENRKGRKVSLVVLTDGSANIALDGSANRKAAFSDALAVSRQVDASGFSALIIDVSKLASKQARELSEKMGADYLPMPFASAQNISAAVSPKLQTS